MSTKLAVNRKSLRAVGYLERMMAMERTITDHQRSMQRNTRLGNCNYILEQKVDGIRTKLISVKRQYTKEYL